MSKLVWDDIGTRFYETGVDRGVLFLPDGSGVAWSGLTSITEKTESQSSPVFFDGKKIMDSVVVGDYSATLKAITYPDEFLELEGIAALAPGSYIPGQRMYLFNLVYRTMVGNGLEGNQADYKLHIVYNLMAMAQDSAYSTLGDDPTLAEFVWDISAIPEEHPGFRPTAHIIIDTRDADPWLVDDLEDMIYGTEGTPPTLPSFADLITYLMAYARITVTDNGDGTWTATASHEFYAWADPAHTIFVMPHVNAVYLDPVTYELSDTYDISDAP